MSFSINRQNNPPPISSVSKRKFGLLLMDLLEPFKAKRHNPPFRYLLGRNKLYKLYVNEIIYRITWSINHVLSEV